MATVQEIFENSLFRIPDYQRGFAWKEMHLDDFWQDLMNLRDDKFHYTGTLTLEVPTKIDLKKWKGDDWIIETGSFKPYYVVDGQQRITTIVILLNKLIETMDGEDQFLYQSKDDLTGKYIYKRNEKNKLQSYIFGYEIDDPSYEYLKTRIFRQDSSEADLQPETIYTNNLGFADKFFDERITKLSKRDKEKLFRKVTQQLQFDKKIMKEDLDIFVVFETMNNRGKPLTNLEKLKNRLIYLSTLMHDIDENEKKQLRKEVNDVWKSCYEFLGKNKENALSDDLFLRNHFIVYHNFDKERDFPWKNIFKDTYTVQNTVIPRPKVTFNHVRDYAKSLQKTSKIWFALNNPVHARDMELISEEEAFWLIKLNRLGFRVFAPLTIAVYLVTTNVEDRVEYLKQIEAFIFLNYMCANRRSNLGNSDFPYFANYLYNKKHGWTVSKIIEEIKYWTYGDDENDGYYTNEKFIETIKEFSTVSNRSGYYDWSGVRYLLFEYEEHLKGKEQSRARYSTPNSIEHIYPQDHLAPDWKEIFSDFTTKQKKILCNSVGNLLLLRQSKNSELSHREFEFKKLHENDGGTIGGYANGSHSELEVSRYSSWDAKAIFKRGKKILDFFQARWGVTFSSSEMKKLTLVDEQLIEVFKTL